MRSARSSRPAPRDRASESTSTSPDDPAELGPPSELLVARVVGAHGVAGALLCAVLTDYPTRFSETDELLLGEPPEPRRLEWSRLQGPNVVLKLAGIETRSQAEALRGAPLAVRREQAVALPPETYFWYQIIGLEVVDLDGRQLGRVAEVLRTGSNDVYVVRSGDRELLLPAIRDVVRAIDLDQGRMTVELLPGLES